MQIVYHIGANCTDEDLLIRCLLRNADALSDYGTAVPRPGAYRSLIRDTIHGLGGRPPSPEARDILLDAMLEAAGDGAGAEAMVDEAPPDRMVLSNPDFICVPPRIFERGIFYAEAEAKVRGLRRLFPDDEVQLFLSLRDPATFLPAVFAAAHQSDFGAFMQGVDPHDVRWSGLVSRIRACAPRMPVTVWCNEDTPLLWGDILRRMAGLPEAEPLEGEYDLVARIMRPDGMDRLLAYLASHPPRTPEDRRRVIAGFLQKYALTEEIEEEVDLPGWTDATLAALSRDYEADMSVIAGMEGVTFLTP